MKRLCHLITRLRARLMNLIGALPKDRSKLVSHIRDIKKKGGFHASERAIEMIDGVLSMSEWEIRDVMIPKNDIVGLSVSDSYETAVALVRDKQHSRYPVFAENGEQVSGILLAKDLLAYAGDPKKFQITKVMRKAIFQPSSKQLDAMLDDFRRVRTHMVVVLDEFDLPVGIVTIEDVLERIVGEIEDESDDEEDQMKTNAPDGGDVIKGSMSVEEFNAVFGASLPEDADSIAGWLAADMGRLPKASEIHNAHGFAFHVRKADDRRIYSIKLVRLPSADADEQTENSES